LYPSQLVKGEVGITHGSQAGIKGYMTVRGQTPITLPSSVFAKKACRYSWGFQRVGKGKRQRLEGGGTERRADNAPSYIMMEHLLGGSPAFQKLSSARRIKGKGVRKREQSRGRSWEMRTGRTTPRTYDEGPPTRLRQPTKTKMRKTVKRGEGGKNH